MKPSTDEGATMIGDAAKMTTYAKPLQTPAEGLRTDVHTKSPKRDATIAAMTASSTVSGS
jgi:hypothetical protein